MIGTAVLIGTGVYIWWRENRNARAVKVLMGEGEGGPEARPKQNAFHGIGKYSDNFSVR